MQGELIRAVEKLRDEASRNGNINWDGGFARLVLFLRRTLNDPHVFDARAAREIVDDLALIDDPEHPADDCTFDRVTDRVVEWCRQHPEPVTNPHDPLLHR
ncbi:hypothetical protein ACIQU5_33795 [Streptomyces sp. NPDC090306]|uniref:hypothetical protein n=1 Tax=Streptomyces sp. NPDC090306 TaxID=3365961 RepID=UPI00381A3D36